MSMENKRDVPLHCFKDVEGFIWASLEKPNERLLHHRVINFTSAEVYNILSNWDFTLVRKELGYD